MLTHIYHAGVLTKVEEKVRDGFTSSKPIKGTLTWRKRLITKFFVTTINKVFENVNLIPLYNQSSMKVLDKWKALVLGLNLLPLYPLHPIVQMEFTKNHKVQSDCWPHTQIAYAMVMIMCFVKMFSTVHHANFVHHCSNILHKVGSHLNISFK